VTYERHRARVTLPALLARLDEIGASPVGQGLDPVTVVLKKRVPLIIV
jgi:hypothetical protein